MQLTFLIALPLLVVCFIALLQARHVRFIEAAVVLSAFVEFGLALVLLPSVLANGAVAATSFFSLDAFGAFLSLIIALVGLFVSLYSVGYLRAEVTKGIIGLRRVRQYYLLLELFLFAMMLAVATINPVVMWIAIEATTLSTAFLISFYNKPSATEAAWKYLILNSLGLLLSLLGTLMFLALPELKSGSLTWENLRAAAGDFHPLAVKVAFVFILVGYGTKAGLVPFHTWKPDTYSKAPAPVVALLSGVLLNVAFFAIMRFKGVTDAALQSEFAGGLLIFFGTLSVALAALIIFIQKNYKRLLAYSSIEHAGLIALGFGFGGIGTFAALLHMLYHSLTKALLFFGSGNIFLKYSSTKMKNVTGVLQVLPATTVLFFAGFIAIAGLPPFGIFVSKMLLLSAGMGEHPVLVGFILLSLAVVFFGFFRHLTALLFGEPAPGIEKGEMHILTLFPVFLLAGLIIVLSFHFPAELELLIESAADSLSIKP